MGKPELRGITYDAMVEAHKSMLEKRLEGEWVPMRHDDPYNDGPVWLDENGRLCWAGAGGETECLVLHGDMAVCLWRPKESTP